MINLQICQEKIDNALPDYRAINIVSFRVHYFYAKSLLLLKKISITKMSIFCITQNFMGKNYFIVI